MADYRFDKPWAAESQNVQEFTEEEWVTGIVEKSLVSSSQVNGVIQAVTRRFLDLEAVEDRQYRYDFIVENQAQWNKFINNNLGNAQSVLIRKGQVWTATNAVTLQRVGVIAQEEGAEIRFNGGLTRNSQSPAILSGGVIRGDLTNCRVLYATVTASASAIYENTVFENSYVYTESSTVSLSRGHYSRSVINAAGRIMNAKLTDCKINNVSELTNCTIVRCEIPNNTKLTDCIVIDCDYAIKRYVANLVTGTTFRNCEVNIRTSTISNRNTVIANDTIFKNCKFRINSGSETHVQGIAHDCEFLGGGVVDSLLNSLFICGNSHFALYHNADIETVADKMRYSQICTDAPFYRKLSEYAYYVYEVEGASDLIPGVINSVSDTRARNLKTNTTGNSYFVRFRSSIMGGATMNYGGVIITPTEQLNVKGFTKLTL